MSVCSPVVRGGTTAAVSTGGEAYAGWTRGTEAVDAPTSTAGSSDSTLPVVQAAGRASAPPARLADKTRLAPLMGGGQAPSFAIGRLRTRYKEPPGRARIHALEKPQFKVEL